MAVLRVKGFSGVAPVKSDRALPDQFGVVSINTWLYGDELRGIRTPAPVQGLLLATGTTKVMRIPKGTTGGDPAFPTIKPPPSYLGDSVWKQFTDPDTDIVRGVLTRDQYQRWYFCSPTTGPMYSTYARMQAGQSDYKLGIKEPTAQMTGTVTGGTATNDITRSYVYTFVTEYGEESAPSQPLIMAGKIDGVWQINNIEDPPFDVTRAPIVKKYLYRTITSSSGVATYFRLPPHPAVAVGTPHPGLPIGTVSYTDDGSVDVQKDEAVANNLQLETLGWLAPPENLKGFIAMPNGFLIGFVDNDVCFSEPYNLHAWPVEYVVSTEYPIVGLGVIGQTCVVCTQGYPTAVTGTKPASTSFIKATANEPCLSRGSIVSTPQGVLYASQNGLIAVSPAGIQNVTEQLVTRDEWIKDFAPPYLRCCRYQNGYLALRALPPGQPRSGFFLDPTSIKVALTELSEFDEIANIFSDVWSGEVFYIEGENEALMRYDAIPGGSNPADDWLPTVWKSKEWQLPSMSNMAGYSIYWDNARFTPNDFGTDLIPKLVPVRFIVYADRIKVYDQPVPYNGRAVRLPSGFKADIWSFEIRARAPVYSLHVAETLRELKNV